ncbi:MAG: pyridoxal phosphate-dependent aminotransferase [Lachnospiraceae bacterium]|nr:pyridoxal phosphate-dependent aminotransferase [Lachnospiraceae bacterium]MDY5742345.1 pyridoxal phosphate-dependent aminotransferase [Lachnospiraceae bacterium]
MLKLSKKMQEQLAGSSVIRQLFEEGRKMAELYGEDQVYDFSLGNPYPPAPPAVAAGIKDRLERLSSRELHGYMPNAGYPEVRQAIAASLHKRFGVSYTQEHILMTVGAAAALNLLCACLLEPDDEVICFAPFFGEYRNYVRHQGATLVVAPARTKDLLPDIGALAGLVNERTKMLWLNNPNNPSGIVYPKEVYQELAREVTRLEEQIGHEILVVSDEPYRELVYDGITVPYAAHYFPNSVICYSFSKSLSLPGERIGYLAVSPTLTQAAELVSALTVANRTLGFVNAPSLIQRVVTDCLETAVDVTIYDYNRRLLYDRLTELGFDCIKPQGAFYLMIRSPLDDTAGFVAAAKRQHIVLVDTESFGAPGYVRLAYCVSSEVVKRSLPAFARLAAEFFKA